LVSDLVIHPAIAAAAILLLIITYLLKVRTRQHYLAHYTAGVLTFAMFVVAFPIGLYEVSISPGGAGGFPATLMFHYANFFLAISLVALQSALGMGMLLFGRRRWLYAIHRRLSKYIVVVVLIQGAIGLAVFIGILQYLSL
jgi:hypothetical protein